MQWCRILALNVVVVVSAMAPAVAALATHWVHRDFDAVADDALLAVPLFDTAGGRFFLTDVTIDVYHEGYGTFAVDNDTTAFGLYAVAAREYRDWALSGPGVEASATYQWQSSAALLLRDNGDGATPDFGRYDGYDWGRTGYGSTLHSTHTIGAPFLEDYQANGGGDLDFSMDVTRITNDLAWLWTVPTDYQMAIGGGDPELRLSLRVDYEWDAVPEPGVWVLFGLGGLVLAVRMRRRVPPLLQGRYKAASRKGVDSTSVGGVT